MGVKNEVLSTLLTIQLFLQISFLGDFPTLVNSDKYCHTPVVCSVNRNSSPNDYYRSRSRRVSTPPDVLL